MLKLNPNKVIPYGDKVLGEVVEDKKIGLIHLPDNMEHSGDVSKVRELMNKRDASKITEDRFLVKDDDIALTLKVVKLGPDVKWDLEVGHEVPIKRTFLPDQAMSFEWEGKIYVLFPCTKDFLLGFVKGS